MTNPEDDPDADYSDMRGGNKQSAFAAIIAIIVLIAGITLFLHSSGKGHHAHSPSPTPVRTETTPQLVVPIPRTTTPATTPKPAPSTPRIRWQGTVTISGPDSDKDLDAVPPRKDPRGADLNSAYLELEIHTENGTQIASYGGSARRPGYTDCVNSAYADGAERVEDVERGDVFCLITGSGHIVRLITRRATLTTYDPIITFTATIWETQR